MSIISKLKRRRQRPGDNIAYFGMMGDVVLVNGRAYEIRPDGLHQLPVHPFRQTTLSSTTYITNGVDALKKMEPVPKNAGQYKKDIS